VSDDADDANDAEKVAEFFKSQLSAESTELINGRTDYCIEKC